MAKDPKLVQFDPSDQKWKKRRRSKSTGSQTDSQGSTDPITGRSLTAAAGTKARSRLDQGDEYIYGDIYDDTDRLTGRQMEDMMRRYKQEAIRRGTYRSGDLDSAIGRGMEDISSAYRRDVQGIENVRTTRRNQTMADIINQAVSVGGTMHGQSASDRAQAHKETLDYAGLTGRIGSSDTMARPDVVAELGIDPDMDDAKIERIIASRGFTKNEDGTYSGAQTLAGRADIRAGGADVRAGEQQEWQQGMQEVAQRHGISIDIADRTGKIYGGEPVTLDVLRVEFDMADDTTDEKVAQQAQALGFTRNREGKWSTGQTIQARQQIMAELNSAVDRATKQGQSTGQYIDPDTGVTIETLQSVLKSHTIVMDIADRTGIIGGGQKETLQSLAQSGKVKFTEDMTKDEMVNAARDAGYTQNEDGTFSGGQTIAGRAEKRAETGQVHRESIETKADTRAEAARKMQEAEQYGYSMTDQSLDDFAQANGLGGMGREEIIEAARKVGLTVDPTTGKLRRETLTGRAGSRAEDENIRQELNAAMNRAIAHGNQTGNFIDPDTGTPYETLAKRAQDHGVSMDIADRTGVIGDTMPLVDSATLARYEDMEGEEADYDKAKAAGVGEQELETRWPNAEIFQQDADYKAWKQAKVGGGRGTMAGQQQTWTQEFATGQETSAERQRAHARTIDYADRTGEIGGAGRTLSIEELRANFGMTNLPPEEQTDDKVRARAESMGFTRNDDDTFTSKQSLAGRKTVLDEQRQYWQQSFSDRQQTDAELNTAINRAVQQGQATGVYEDPSTDPATPLDTLQKIQADRKQALDIADRTGLLGGTMPSLSSEEVSQFEGWEKDEDAGRKVAGGEKYEEWKAAKVGGGVATIAGRQQAQSEKGQEWGITMDRAGLTGYLEGGGEFRDKNGNVIQVYDKDNNPIQTGTKTLAREGLDITERQQTEAEAAGLSAREMAIADRTGYMGGQPVFDKDGNPVEVYDDQKPPRLIDTTGTRTLGGSAADRAEAVITGELGDEKTIAGKTFDVEYGEPDPVTGKYAEYDPETGDLIPGTGGLKQKTLQKDKVVADVALNKLQLEINRENRKEIREGVSEFMQFFGIDPKDASFLGLLERLGIIDGDEDNGGNDNGGNDNGGNDNGGSGNGNGGSGNGNGGDPAGDLAKLWDDAHGTEVVISGVSYRLVKGKYQTSAGVELDHTLIPSDAVIDAATGVISTQPISGVADPGDAGGGAIVSGGVTPLDTSGDGSFVGDGSVTINPALWEGTIPPGGGGIGGIDFTGIADIDVQNHIRANISGLSSTQQQWAIDNGMLTSDEVVNALNKDALDIINAPGGVTEVQGIPDPNNSGFNLDGSLIGFVWPEATVVSWDGFTASFGSKIGDANYDAAFDFDGDGEINLKELTSFGETFDAAGDAAKQIASRVKGAAKPLVNIIGDGKTLVTDVGKITLNVAGNVLDASGNIVKDAGELFSEGQTAIREYFKELDIPFPTGPIDLGQLTDILKGLGNLPIDAVQVVNREVKSLINRAKLKIPDEWNGGEALFAVTMILDIYKGDYTSAGKKVAMKAAMKAFEQFAPKLFATVSPYLGPIAAVYNARDAILKGAMPAFFRTGGPAGVAKAIRGLLTGGLFSSGTTYKYTVSGYNPAAFGENEKNKMRDIILDENIGFSAPVGQGGEMLEGQALWDAIQNGDVTFTEDEIRDLMAELDITDFKAFVGDSKTATDIHRGYGAGSPDEAEASASAELAITGRDREYNTIEDVRTIKDGGGYEAVGGIVPIVVHRIAKLKNWSPSDTSRISVQDLIQVANEYGGLSAFMD